MAVVFGLLWVIMRFVEPISKFLGTVVSKVMMVFIAAIGVHMIMMGLSHYFAMPK